MYILIGKLNKTLHFRYEKRQLHDDMKEDKENHILLMRFMHESAKIDQHFIYG